jgi:hypothetical protein
MAKSKVKKKPVKGKSKRGVKVNVAKSKSKTLDEVAVHQKVKKERRKKAPEVKSKRGRKKKEIPAKEEELPKQRRRKAIEEAPPTYETSGGPRKRYFIVLEEETFSTFSHKTYMRQEYSPVLMNQIVRIATKTDIKMSRKDMELWMDEKAFDDGTDENGDDAPIVRPYDPSTKPYNRMRRRFTCTLEETVVEKFRKTVKTNLYGCYLINHLLREYLRGNLELKWTAKQHADSLNWAFGDIQHGGDLILYEPGEPAAIVTHEWAHVLAEQKAAKELEEASKPKRKRTFACIYPGCNGRASKHVSAEDKTDIYYKCNKCKKTFHRTAKKEIVPEQEEMEDD